MVSEKSKDDILTEREFFNKNIKETFNEIKGNIDKSLLNTKDIKRKIEILNSYKDFKIVAQFEHEIRKIGYEMAMMDQTPWDVDSAGQILFSHPINMSSNEWVLNLSHGFIAYELKKYIDEKLEEFRIDDWDFEEIIPGPKNPSQQLALLKKAGVIDFLLVEFENFKSDKKNMAVLLSYILGIKYDMTLNSTVSYLLNDTPGKSPYQKGNEIDLKLDALFKSLGMEKKQTPKRNKK